MGRRPNLDTYLGLIHNLRCRSSARCGERCGGGRRQRDLLFWPTQDVQVDGVSPGLQCSQCDLAGAVGLARGLAQCSRSIRWRRPEARLVDGGVAHVLDNPLAARHHHDVQYNELMTLAFKSFFNSATRGELISMPRQIEMTEFAGKVYPGPKLHVLNQHLIRQGKQRRRMKDSVLVNAQGFVLHGQERVVRQRQAGTHGPQNPAGARDFGAWQE
jgi:hypothetical protein